VRYFCSTSEGSPPIIIDDNGSVFWAGKCRIKSFARVKDVERWVKNGIMREVRIEEAVLMPEFNL
jgi:hypothetical protein